MDRSSRDPNVHVLPSENGDAERDQSCHEPGDLSQRAKEVCSGGRPTVAELGLEKLSLRVPPKGEWSHSEQMDGFKTIWCTLIPT